MSTWIALMGKRNAPTDGVEDYCAFLAQALTKRDVKLDLVRVDWAESDWKTALQSLARQSDAWRDQWVFLQYTALAWSGRGFPFGALRALDILERHGARVAVVFHEFKHQEAGRFPVRMMRSACQDFVIRRLHKRAALSIFTVPEQKVSWLRANHRTSAFIPIGANIPEPSAGSQKGGVDHDAEKTVAVFCFTPSPNRHLEIAEIIQAAQAAQRGGQRIQLLILGRGSQEVLPEIERGLTGNGVRVWATGILPAEEISRELSKSDVLLFVSGQVSQTRGSALAGVACGLPILGYAGAAEGTPLMEAGLQLAPFRDRQALAEALARVVSDSALREELHQRSLAAQRKYFSWDAIAERYTSACSRDTVAVTSLGEPGRTSVQSRGIF